MNPYRTARYVAYAFVGALLVFVIIGDPGSGHPEEQERYRLMLHWLVPAALGVTLAELGWLLTHRRDD